jgi:putative spermidine/putrescine transport system permease protein
MNKGSGCPKAAAAGQGRKASPWRLIALLGPALCTILLLFGGGLFLGLLQALGHSPAQDQAAVTTGSLEHFIHVLQDPDFGKSLVLTLYISITSTLVAAAVSIGLALALMRWAADSRAVNFMLQIPLTVPHLVIAIAVILLLTPAGLISRLLAKLSIIQGPAAFPLLVNDSTGIGILIVYIWKEIPFITFMLLSVLKNMGTELLEAGATLNASRFQRFIFIILPIIAPSLGSACLIVFAFTFGAFEVPYLLGRTYPLVLPVWAYKNYSDVDLVARPEGIAIGLIIAAIVIFSIILSQILLHFGRKRGLTI